MSGSIVRLLITLAMLPSLVVGVLDVRRATVTGEMRRLFSRKPAVRRDEDPARFRAAVAARALVRIAPPAAVIALAWLW
jgi:hypothetical protein